MGTSDKSVKPAVGGGAKKILYTLKTVNRIGLNHSAKALTAKNACKACGLGTVSYTHLTLPTILLV